MKKRQKFKKTIIASYIFLVVTALGVLGYVYLTDSKSDIPFLILGVPIVVITVVLLSGFVVNRCPHCNQVLIKVPFNAEKCPYCNEEFKDEE